jgi:hypothetical protein
LGNPAEKFLWQCATTQRQLVWIKRALRSGMVLADSDLWLSGVNKPSEVIDVLMRAGMQIETTRKRVTDAAGQKHNDLAWKLAS